MPTYLPNFPCGYVGVPFGEVRTFLYCTRLTREKKKMMRKNAERDYQENTSQQRGSFRLGGMEVSRGKATAF